MREFMAYAQIWWFVYWEITTIKISRFTIGFRGISQLDSAFIFLR